MQRTRDILDKIKGCRVTVIGDLILDEYLYGEVTRISPEAPVPIVRVVREHAVLGWAANVAANLREIGASPILIGAIKDDYAGGRLLGLLECKHIPSAGIVIDNTRPTIIKTRIIGQHQQMLRIDREEPGELHSADELKEKLKLAVAESKAVIISDYAKGVISASLLQLLFKRLQNSFKESLTFYNFKV